MAQEKQNWSFPEKLKHYLNSKIFLSKDLVQLNRSAPIDFDLKKCRWEKYDKAKVVKILGKFEFYSLIPRLPQPKLPEQKEEEEIKEEEKPPKTRTLF